MQTSLSETKAEELWAAQEKARVLLEEIEKCSLIRPSITGSAVNKQIYGLAEELFGIKICWHKRIVRSGPNTSTACRGIGF